MGLGNQLGPSKLEELTRAGGFFRDESTCSYVNSGGLVEWSGHQVGVGEQGSVDDVGESSFKDPQ